MKKKIKKVPILQNLKIEWMKRGVENCWRAQKKTRRTIGRKKAENVEIAEYAHF